MEINTEALRKLKGLISTLPDDTAEKLLEKLPLNESVSSQTIVDEINQNLGNDWGTFQYKTLWRAAEIAELFNHWTQPYMVPPTQTTLTKLRKQLDGPQFNKKQLIALELSKQPQLLMIARTPSPHRSMIAKTLVPYEVRDTLYWFPDLGIALTYIHVDENGKIFEEVLKTSIFSSQEEFRFKSIIITKMFKAERYINQLVVNADFQITGFDGLDEIRFIGPDVKRGLGGLNRRQDIRVHMNEIGPNIEVENKNWRVKIGPNLQLKTLVGIYEIHMLFYPNLYPSQDQVMSLKDELQTTGEVNLSELLQSWDLDKDKLEYYLLKLIENGFIRASLDNGKLKKN